MSFILIVKIIVIDKLVFCMSCKENIIVLSDTIKSSNTSRYVITQSDPNLDKPFEKSNLYNFEALHFFYPKCLGILFLFEHQFHQKKSNCDIQTASNCYAIILQKVHQTFIRNFCKKNVMYLTQTKRYIFANRNTYLSSCC